MKLLVTFIATFSFIGISWAADFSHPGLLNSKVEYELMRMKVKSGAEPWANAFKYMPNYGAHVPKPVAILSESVAAQYNNDGRAAYGSALRYIVTGDAQHAEKAKRIIDAWSRTLQSYGTITPLSNGVALGRFLFAAEILKHSYSGWPTVDQCRFAAMVRLLLKRLWPANVSSTNRWHKANSAANGAHARMAAAVYLNDSSLFDQAVNEARSLISFYIGRHGNPVPIGFTYETCRYLGGNGPGDIGTLKGGDIKHAQYGLGWLVQSAEIAKKQGLDLYSHVDPVDKASLLTALIYHEPFVGYPRRGSAATWPCKIQLDKVPYGTWYHMPWQVAYNHYRDARFKKVIGAFLNPNYGLSPYKAVTTGADFEMLTHNYNLP